MSLVPFIEFQEHRERRLKRISMIRNLTPLNDNGEHDPDREGQKHMDEAAERVGANGAEQPEHTENQRDR
jgi:hypothetical protein